VHEAAVLRPRTRGWRAGAGAIVLLALLARDAGAVDVCTADLIVGLDPGCPAGVGVCTLTLDYNVLDAFSCKLDFGTRPVVLAGTLESAGWLDLAAGALTVAAGGRIRAPEVAITTSGDVEVQRGGTTPGVIDVSGFDNGHLTIRADGAFRLDGRINGDAGGGGKYAATIDIQAASIITGTASLLSADAIFSDEGSSLYGALVLVAVGAIDLQGTVSLRGPSSGYEQIGGEVNLQAASLRLAPGSVLRGGTIYGEIEGDVVIERAGDGRAARIEARGTGTVLGISATGTIRVAGELDADGSSCERGVNGLSLYTEGALTIAADAVLSASGVPDPGEDDVCSAYVDLLSYGPVLFEGTLVQLGGGDPEGDTYIDGEDVTVRGRIRMDGWYQRSWAGSLNVSGSGSVIVDADITVVAGASTLGIERGGYSGNVDIDGREVFVGGRIIADGTLYGSPGLIDIEGEQVTVTATLSARAHRLHDYPGRVLIGAYSPGDFLDFRGSIDVANGGEVVLHAADAEIGGRISGQMQFGDPGADNFWDTRITIGTGTCAAGRVSLTGEIDVSAFGCEGGVCAEPWQIEVEAADIEMTPAAVIENTGRIGGDVRFAGQRIALAGRIDVSGSEAPGTLEAAICAGAGESSCAISGVVLPPAALLDACVLPTPTAAPPTGAASATPTATATPAPSSTAAPLACAGDCDGNGVVAPADLMRALALVNVCQGNASGCAGAPAGCAAADLDGSGSIGAGEISHVVAALGARCD